MVSFELCNRQLKGEFRLWLKKEIKSDRGMERWLTDCTLAGEHSVRADVGIVRTILWFLIMCRPNSGASCGT